jgi:hypothetical protein
MTNDTFDSACLRHPDVTSNLRCGRCDDLICPQCMVQSPVGARCPDCANIGQSPIFRSTPIELTSAIAVSAGGAIFFGLIYAILVWILWKFLPFNLQVGSIAVSFIIAFGGAPVGNFVKRAGKNKLDARLRVVAAFTMFVVWVVGYSLAALFGVWSGVFLNIIVYIGLGVGIYVAMNKVRPS